MLSSSNTGTVSDIYCEIYISDVKVVKLWGLPSATALRIKYFLRN
jgi:hypothetical protein